MARIASPFLNDPKCLPSDFNVVRCSKITGVTSNVKYQGQLLTFTLGNVPSVFSMRTFEKPEWLKDGITVSVDLEFGTIEYDPR